MQALRELFTTDVGLMSIGVIVFMLGMGVFFIRYFLRHIREDTARAAQQAESVSASASDSASASASAPSPARQ
jgi:hypothetical protein